MIRYDAVTDNGIEYVSRIYSNNAEYRRIVTSLDKLNPAKEALESGAGITTGYTIGNRSKTSGQLTPENLLKRWDNLWKAKRMIEGNWRPRKSVGVVFRDW